MTLYWNERGQVGCDKPGHMPYQGSDTFVWERWEPRDEETARNQGLTCETCAAAERLKGKAKRDRFA